MRILDSMQLVDERLFASVFRGKRLLKRWAHSVSHTADGHLYLVFPLFYWLLDSVQGRTFFLIAFPAFVVERCLYFFLKNKLKRRRPPAAIPGLRSLVTPSDEFSFPSGHTSAAFLFATLCVLWFGMVALPLYAWALCVGFSRVLLGVHFPGDILAGALMGSGIGLLVVSRLA